MPAPRADSSLPSSRTAAGMAEVKAEFAELKKEIRSLAAIWQANHLRLNRKLDRLLAKIGG
jgi:hypothetical protein